jgi:putative ABC transport system permease protein
MIRIVLRGIRTRKLRTILTALAILLGVAMIAGTFVLTDTIKVAFDQIFTQGNKGVAASITGKKVVTARDSKPPPISASLVEQITKVPGVAAVDGSVQSDAAQILNDKGKAVGGNAPTFGFTVPQKQFNPYTLVSGTYPTGASQVAIDKGTADAQHWQVGHTILIATQRPAQLFRITGIVKYGTLDSLGGATISLFDVATAQSLFDREGKFDRISVAADPGVAQQELVNRLRDAHLTSTVPLKIETGKQQTHDDSASVAQGLSFFTYALLAFGGIAVFVGAFIIFNTFSITVAQRTREFGMLRAIGASRRQVLGSVLLEAFVVGVVASLVGLGLGILLASGLEALLKSFGIDLPHVGLVFATRTAVVSLLVGVGVTMVAGLVPAIRATRISPVAALREGPAESTGRSGHRTAIAGVILVVLAAAAVAYGVFGNPSTSTRLLTIAVGSVLLFVAVAMVTPRLVPFVVMVVGWPLRRLFGLTGRLASENATRNPGRTAVTAASLMIGLGLVAFVTIFAEGLRVSANAAIDKTFTADLVISPSQNSNVGVLPLGVEQRIAKVPGIALVSPVRAENARIMGHGTHQALGVDPATFVKTYRFDWRQGNDATFRSLGPHDALMERDVAKSTHLKVGDTFSILTPNGQHGTFTLKGIYRDNNYLTGFVIPLSRFTMLFDERQDVAITANIAPGQDLAAVEAAVKQSLSVVPNVSVQTRQQLKQQNQNNVNNLLGLLYALLALSIIISAFGIVNTLVLSIFERTRELGLLRAVGTSRRQVRRMIRYESVITAVLGAILGLILGIFFAWIFTLGLSDQGLVFAVPIGRLLLFLVFAIIVGVLAAIFPARRASRLNVLDALAYE